MELLVFGEAGSPVLVFPTFNGRFYEYEDSGMVGALEEKINSGLVQLFCVDSFDKESWRNSSIHPHDRVRRQVTYESYILEEVLPLIRGLNQAQQVTVTGCDLGGYQSLNLTLRHPEVVNSCVSLSGRFDLKPFMNGYYDDDFYFNNPLDYLLNLEDRQILARYANIRFTFAVADHDPYLNENRRMTEILRLKNIPRTLETWPHNGQDNLSLWRQMAEKFLP